MKELPSPLAPHISSLVARGHNSYCSCACQPFSLCSHDTLLLSSSQLGRNAGPPLLHLFLNLLRHLVVHCEQLDTQNQQKCKAAHAESELFLDMKSVASLELANDQVPLPPAIDSPFAFFGRQVYF